MQCSSTRPNAHLSPIPTPYTDPYKGLFDLPGTREVAGRSMKGHCEHRDRPEGETHR